MSSLGGWRLACGLAMCLPMAAAGHALSPCYLGLDEGADGRVRVLMKVPRAGHGPTAVVPHLPAACRREGPPRRSTTRSSVLTRWRARCPGGLAGGVLRLEGLGAATGAALVSWRRPDGGLWTGVLRGPTASLRLPAEGAPRASGLAVGAYLSLGVRHILSGIDHLLFVLGLLLLVGRRSERAGARWRTLLGTITAFTAAHSVTLSLAALGGIALRPAPVEVVIALSILLLAQELAARGERRTLASERPWMVAFAFGLLHGFGFAGALREVGLPEGSVAPALVLFNVGVELGQLIFVCAAVTLWSALVRLGGAALRRGAERLAVYGLGTTATYWCIERVVALWG